MKNINYLVLFVLAALGFASCQKEYDFNVTDKGPQMTIVSYDASGRMGGVINFEVSLDDELPLSTLKAKLFFGEDMVNEVVIRTKQSGKYEGEIEVPFFKNIPDGDAMLSFEGQNIQFGLTQKDVQVAITRPALDKLTFHLDGKEYEMMPTNERYVYSVVANFGSKSKGYISSEPIDGGKPITFGWNGKDVSAGTTEPIPFSNATAGEYMIWINILNFECGPFVSLKLNGNDMTMVDEDNYRYIGDFKNGDAIAIEGIADLSSWTVDTDFLKQSADKTTIEFGAIDGRYAVIANFKYNFITAEVYSGDKPMSLQPDGSGAIWIVGDNIGKPSLSNMVGWTTEKALCMSPVAKGKFQITVVAGLTMGKDAINFKFFGGAKSWDNAFTHTTLTTTSKVIGIGTGEIDETGSKHDSGNLYLHKDVKLVAGDIYTITIDVTGGVTAGVMTVEQNGHQELPAADIKINGTAMEQVMGDTYAVALDLTQGGALSMSGADAFMPEWFDDNYFANNGDGTLKLKAVSGKYRVTAKKDLKHISVIRLNDDGSEATLKDDGTGGLWLMGWGVGLPSLETQIGFNAGAAYCMAEISPSVYRLTGKGGPEKGSSIGQYFRIDYLSFKPFHQNGWGGEMKSAPLAPGTEMLLKSDDNMGLADGVTLDLDATYELTVDVTGGKDNPLVTFRKL